jgi:DcmR-like sensory protein
MKTKGEWQRCDTKAFWSDIASDDHVVQIYDNDTMLINTLADYASDGFNNGDSVIIIATAIHLKQLNSRLLSCGHNLNILSASDQYITLNAHDMLSKFMINGKPDEQYFLHTLTPIIKRAGKNGRKVRSFGEMVALLWQSGHSTATIELEHLWNKFSEKENFCLFCAYPKNGFSNDASASVMHICSAHSKLVGRNENFPSEIQYKNVV